MPKAKLHWAHDALAAALVAGVSALVFWLLPPSAHARALAALDPSAHHLASKEPARCNADNF